jgi:hypothetical protein
LNRTALSQRSFVSRKVAKAQRKLGAKICRKAENAERQLVQFCHSLPSSTSNNKHQLCALAPLREISNPYAHQSSIIDFRIPFVVFVLLVSFADRTRVESELLDVPLKTRKARKSRAETIFHKVA